MQGIKIFKQLYVSRVVLYIVELSRAEPGLGYLINEMCEIPAVVKRSPLPLRESVGVRVPPHRGCSPRPHPRKVHREAERIGLSKRYKSVITQTVENRSR